LTGSKLQNKFHHNYYKNIQLPMPNYSIKNKLLCLIFLLFLAVLSACGSKNKDADAAKEAEKKNPKSTVVTVTKVKNQALEITETTQGTLEGIVDPTIAAEMSARVVKVHVYPGVAVNQGQLIVTLDASDFGMQRNEAQAEVARVQALIENQKKIVARNQVLVDKKFLSQNALDNDTSQQKVLNQQLAAAKARVGSINHNSSKANIYAPVSGVVQKKMVDTGDFVRAGDPILQIVSTQKLIAHLPFPEHIAAKIHAGLTVRLTTPTTSNAVESKIRELKPMITEGNRTVDVITNINDAEGWQPGASVTGTVVLGSQAAAMMVPEQSVVLRPAGEVVYVVRKNVAYQAIVKTGLNQNGMIEITEGVNENDTIVVDGAGFLTNDTPVKIAPEKTI
jgi:membrane fusion protein, multidrug efflux system